MTMTFGSLFAGIGGFDLGFERAGMVCEWQVEIDDYCQRVLAKHWPEVKRYGDIRECGRHNLETVDVICGGFPCQPYSVAGKQKGKEDDRNLWPEFLRVVREMRPRWVVGENVPGIVRLYLDTVLSDLEGEGYTCWTFNIPAVAFDAPHRRERIFVVAYSSSDRPQREDEPKRKHDSMGRDKQPGRNGKDGIVAHAKYNPIQSDEQHRLQNSDTNWDNWWSVEPDVGRVADGVPFRVDRLRSLGNAVVPQVAEWIARRIVEVENVSYR